MMNYSKRSKGDEQIGKKIGIVTHIVPPAAAGTAMRIKGFFSGIDANQYCIFTCSAYQHPSVWQNHPEKLQGKHILLKKEKYAYNPDSPRTPVLQKILMAFLQVFERAFQLTTHVKREKCAYLVVFTGNLIDPPAALIASLLTGARLVVAADDYFTYQWRDMFERRFAAFWESIILKTAYRVIVSNDSLAREYKTRYNVAPHVIYNPCKIEPYHKWESDKGITENEQEKTIVFTGSVYHANYDVFLSLIQAITSINDRRWNLHIYTAQPKELIQKHGIDGPVVFHDCLSNQDIYKVQCSADILYLPLGFNTGIPEVIKTSGPFKMGEYLAVGRPVLVHAPADSFICWYFRKHECGLVVDSPSPQELAKAIIRIQTDLELRDRIGKNARKRADIDFNSKVVQKNFFKVLSSVA